MERRAERPVGLARGNAWCRVLFLTLEVCSLVGDDLAGLPSRSTTMTLSAATPCSSLQLPLSPPPPPRQLPVVAIVDIVSSCWHQQWKPELLLSGAPAQATSAPAPRLESAALAVDGRRQAPFDSFRSRSTYMLIMQVIMIMHMKKED